MTNILTQLNPAAWSGIILLIALSFLGLIVLRLIKSGKAKSPGDLVKVARERAATAKAGKEAVKQAEAAIAEPIASSRLSRIGARCDTVAPAVADMPQVEAVADTMALVETSDEPRTDQAEYTEELIADAADHIEAAADPVDTDAFVADDLEVSPAATTDAGFDFADPANHPQNWNELIAIIDVLDAALTRPWAEDRMTLQLSRDQLAASAAGDEAATLALSRQLSTTDLARTINSAAREQAAEIIAAVREFAHQQAFSPQDCSAVLQALQQIEWMALIARGDAIERRTLPLTRHDPEAPLWVAEAWDDLRTAGKRAAA